MVEPYEIWTIICQVVTIASIIVKWTPTPKDDEIVGKIQNFIEQWIAFNKKK